MVDGWNVGWTGRLFQRLIVKGWPAADLVACVSHLTRRELLALGLADESRSAMVLNGLNDDFSPDGAGRGAAPDRAPRSLGAGQIPDARRLGPRTQEPPRGAGGLHRAAASARPRRHPAVVQQLVFVGPALTPEMAALAQAHGVADRIKTVHKVSHEQLRALYAERHRAAVPLAAGRLRLAGDRGPGLRLPGLHLRPRADERDRRRLLVGNYVPDGHTSMQAFRRVLERELPRLGCELRVIAPPKRVLTGRYTSRWWKWLGYIDKYVLFLPSLAQPCAVGRRGPHLRPRQRHVRPAREGQAQRHHLPRRDRGAGRQGHGRRLEGRLDRPAVPAPDRSMAWRRPTWSPASRS